MTMATLEPERIMNGLTANRHTALTVLHIRFLHGQNQNERQDTTSNGRYPKRPAPAEVLRDIATDDGTNSGTQDGDETHDCNGRASLFYGEEIANDRRIQGDGGHTRAGQEPEHDDLSDCVTKTRDQGEDNEEEVVKVNHR
jgi:hypothetical protein